MKGLPFTLDRSQWGSLINQMTDGLRRAIHTGYYRPGDKLPSVRELVAHFGVSNRVPVAAIKKLREEGLVEAAPRNGCVVRHSRMPHWKGHVMCVVASGDFSFSTAMKVERIREAVFRANYLFTQVTVPRRKTGRLDMGVLDYHLRQSVDMAVLFGVEKCIRTRLERANVPFVHVEGTEGGLCVGAFKYDYDEAFREFVSACRERGVKRIVRVVKFAGQFNRLADVLSDAGIENEEWNLAPRRQGEGRLEILRNTAFRIFSARLSEGREWLPDAFVFTDDYLATGAVAALLSFGIRFPDDVRIATLANRGNLPVIPGAFGCFEYDPFMVGDKVAEDVVARLNGETRPSSTVVPVPWKVIDEYAQ